ncbi:hypothetical protein CGH36_23975, partial [Vibrio parahaemolyticus]
MTRKSNILNFRLTPLLENNNIKIPINAGIENVIIVEKIQTLYKLSLDFFLYTLKKSKLKTPKCPGSSKKP